MTVGFHNGEAISDLDKGVSGNYGGKSLIQGHLKMRKWVKKNWR